MITRLAEQFGEQRIVAPVALVAHGVKRKDMLEHKTCKIPRSHHVAVGDEFPFLRPSRLSGHIGLVIPIELRMMAVETLSDNQYNMRTAITATVNLYAVNALHELSYLLSRQTIGIDTEHQPIDGLILHGMCLFRQLMFNVADIAVGHQPMVCHLVMPTGRSTVYKQEEHGYSSQCPGAF